MRDERPVPRLTLVTDRVRASLPLEVLVGEAVAGGVDAVQIREKDLERAELTDLARRLRNIVGNDAKLAINGELELAAELGLDVHVPETGPPTKVARSIVGEAALVSRSVHSIRAARANPDADYLVAGHVFASRSKPGLPPIGIAGLREIVDASTPPVLAIGGISAQNVRAVMSTGAHGVAVIDAIATSAQPQFSAKALRGAIDEFEAQERNMRAPDGELVVVVNGKDVVVSAGSSVADFLASKGFREKLVVVELNGHILDRGSFAATPLTRGDKVEIVHFVGGG